MRDDIDAELAEAEREFQIRPLLGFADSLGILVRNHFCHGHIIWNL